MPGGQPRQLAALADRFGDAYTYHGAPGGPYTATHTSGYTLTGADSLELADLLEADQERLERGLPMPPALLAVMLRG